MVVGSIMTMAYQVFGYVGLFSIFGAVLFGFRHDPGAPWRNLLERRVYIVVTVATWLAVLWYHPPLPEPSINVPGPLRFAATVGLLMAVFASGS